MPPERTRVRVRGIYATALTERLRGAVEVVDPSGPIADRFDETFGAGPPGVEVGDTADRLGVGITGSRTGVQAVLDHVSSVSRDVLAWTDAAPLGAVFEAVVTETLGRGAVVDLGPREGFLRYDAADRRVEVGDELEVQVRQPAPPWDDRRPEVGTGLEAPGGPVTLVRGADGPQAALADSERVTELVRTLELLEQAPPEGWAVRFEPDAATATRETIEAGLALAAERAAALPPARDGPDPPLSTTWVWFGRQTRFALDELRRGVTTTMPGHHRLKAATADASTAVDLVEALCSPTGDDGFPFAVVADQWGPAVGDRLALSHGKPDGRRFPLGVGEVTDRDGETVTLRREMTPGGEYDGLGVPRAAGDVAVSRLTEGRWWYPTVYRDADGGVKGTYVNVCTPLELFPDAASYVDLEVDVIKHADGTVERLDDDELDAAVAAGHLPKALAAKAREVADSIVRGLTG